MRDKPVLLCSLWVLALAGLGPAALSQASSTAIALPAGTKLELAITRAVWTAKVKPGDTLYAETTFPVADHGAIAIPAGTFVQGEIESVTPPTRRLNHAEFHLRFDKVIYSNGYVAQLSDTASLITVQVSRSSDILLDNGTQMEISLGSAVNLDANQVAAAVAISRPPKPGEFAHATLCRPTAGSPGSEGVTIPGTPATPPTVIPGGPGMPDTVIPGTPGTPSQVVGQIPGTPGTVCPEPPIVISSVPDGVQLSQKSNLQP